MSCSRALHPFPLISFIGLDLMALIYGVILEGTADKTGTRQKLEPIKKVFTYVFFSEVYKLIIWFKITIESQIKSFLLIKQLIYDFLNSLSF